ncbi:MAG: hypothetical protein IT320_19580 [Anaerolineae bacterium]|nr:hypothetical protein [Anaerolineae bacterium]
MTRERFLTVGWNNRISFSLGLIVVVYVIAVLATASWGSQEGFIGLTLIGLVF